MINLPYVVKQLTHQFDLLYPIRQWLAAIEITQPQTARFFCRMIPSHCPFERDINLFGYTLFHIPPMCKLNPLYDQLMELRFKSLTYLADVCGENIMLYLEQ
jgi:Mo-dependent nitrogenase C-terminus